MSMPPNDDNELLVNFLREHRPVPPQPSLELEARIVKLTARLPMASALTQGRFWLIPAAIATGLIMSWSGIPTQKTTAELASLETFIENTWDGVDSEPLELETDWVPPTYPANSAGNFTGNSSRPHYQPTTDKQR